MALNILIGGAGCGKTYKLRETIIDRSVKEPEKTFFVLVPEQFTLETQREYVTAHPDGGILNIDVLSFVRLAYRTFEDCDYKAPEMLTDTGKAMIIKKVMSENSGRLGAFRRNIRKPGFIDEMKSLISEFLTYSIDDDELAKMLEASKERDLLSRKLKDISLIYSEYLGFLRGNGGMISGEEMMQLLADLIGRTGYLKGKVVCLDGFTGFTPSQYVLVESIIKSADDVYVTITGNERILGTGAAVGEFDMMNLSRRTISKLRKIAAENGVEENIELLLRHKENEALSFLEQNIFKAGAPQFERERVRKDGSTRSDTQEEMGKDDSLPEITVTAAENKNDEVRFITTQIERLVRNKGLRYRDIAVVTGDLEEYKDVFLRAFNAVGIPCFPDTKTPVMANPLIEMIRSAIEAAQTNMAFDPVFRFIKCGLTGFNADGIAELENYAVATGIRGTSGFSKEWTVAFKKPYPMDLGLINDLREKVSATLGSFVSAIRKAKCANEMIPLIKKLVEAYGAGEKLAETAESFALSDDPDRRVRSLEYSQIYRETMSCIDELEQLLGTEEITLTELSNMLDAGFSDIKMRLLPAASDQIVVGDMERTRLRDIKVLFLAGVNEGSVPHTDAGGGILSEYERGLLADMDFELAPTRRQSICISEFYLYTLLSKPTQMLYLSYVERNADGKPVQAAYPVKSVMSLFPQIRPRRTEKPGKNSDAPDIMGLDGGITYMIDALNTDDKEIIPPAAAVYKHLKKLAAGAGTDPDVLIDRVINRTELGRITSEAARRLYGEILKGSVSRLERFTSCAFAHFLNYGLRLQERRELKLAAPDVGNIYHKAMELYSNSLKEQGLTWHDVPAQTRDDLIGKVVKEAVEAQETVYFKASERAAYLINNFERVVRRSIVTIEEQVRAGGFEPELFEQHFDFTTKNAILHGVIDRIDVARGNDGKMYFRIIDYKSGDVKFDLAKFCYGLQIQLVVYMEAARKLFAEQGIDAEPAALLYYHITDPVAENKADPTGEIRKALAMDGLLTAKTDLLILNDAALGKGGVLEAGVSSTAIPVKITGKGEIESRSMSRLYSTENLKVLSEHLYRNIDDATARIMEGDVAKSPANYKEPACKYCAYSSVCAAGGNVSERRLPAMKRDACFAMMEAEDVD